MEQVCDIWKVAMFFFLMIFIVCLFFSYFSRKLRKYCDNVLKNHFVTLSLSKEDNFLYMPVNKTEEYFRKAYLNAVEEMRKIPDEKLVEHILNSKQEETKK